MGRYSRGEPISTANLAMAQTTTDPHPFRLAALVQRVVSLRSQAEASILWPSSPMARFWRGGPISPASLETAHLSHGSLLFRRLILNQAVEERRLLTGPSSAWLRNRMVP